MQRMTIENILKKINKFPLGGSILITSFIVIVNLVVIGFPRFATNDDIGMMFFSQGIIWESTPNLVFINAGLGDVIFRLSATFPTFPIYPSFLFLITVISAFYIFYNCLLLSRSSVINLFVLIIFLCIVIVTFSFRLQFTSASGLSTLAGCSGILALYRKGNWTYFKYVPIIFFLTLGILLRSDSALLVFISFTLVCAARFPENLTSVIGSSILFATLYFAAGYLNALYYDDRWDYFFLINNLKSSIIDFSAILSTTGVGAEYIEYVAARSWHYNDTNIFSVEFFSNIIERFRTNCVDAGGFLCDLRGFYFGFVECENFCIFEKFVFPVLSISAGNPMLVYLFVFLIVVIWRGGIDNKFLVVIVFGFVLINLAMFIVFNRVVERVFVSILCLFLYFSLVVFLSMSRESADRIIPSKALMLLPFLFFSIYNVGLSFFNRPLIDSNEKFQIIFDYYRTIIPADGILYSVGFPLAFELSPFSNFRYLNEANFDFLISGWNSQSPIQIDYLSSINISSERFFLDLSQREVFIPAYQSANFQPLIDLYCERFGIHLAFPDVGSYRSFQSFYYGHELFPKGVHHGAFDMNDGVLLRMQFSDEGSCDGSNFLPTSPA